MKEKNVRTPVQKRSREKRRRILDAAKVLFSERGFSGTTAKDIAAKADVSIGTFYAYVEDKKALFMEVVLEYYKEITGQVFSPEFLEKLHRAEGREFCRLLVEMALNAHSMSPLFHRETMAMALTDPDMEALVAKEDAKVVAAVVSLLEANENKLRINDLEAAAVVILGAVEETVHALLLFENPIGRDRLTTELADMLNRYLFKGDNAS